MNPSKVQITTKFALRFSVGLYLLGALLALGLPEHYIETFYFLARAHWLFVPPSFSARLVLLWCCMTIPLLIVASREGRRIDWRVVLLPLALVCLASAWVKPPHSPDIYTSVGHGRQVMLGVNPYSWTLLQTPVVDNVILNVHMLSRNWVQMPCMYGPLYLVIMLLVNVFSPSPDLIVLGRMVKLSILPAYFLWGWVLWRVWEKHPYRSLLLLTVVANPVAIFLFCVEGHVDIFMIAALALTAYFLDRNSGVAAGLAFCAAASIKMVPVPTFPVLACWIWRKDSKSGIQFSATFLLSYLGSHFALSGGEWEAVARLGREWQDFLWSGLLPRLFLLANLNDVVLMSRVATGILCLTVGLLCLLILRDKFQDSPSFAAGLVYVVVVLTHTHVRPWYNFWFWPLFWMSSQDRRYILVSAALCSTTTLFSLWHTLMEYVPYVNAIAIALDLSWRYWCHRHPQTDDA